MPELIAPAGDLASLRAAIQAKADAVYFGVKELNMRAAAKNFELKQLPKIVKLCHDNKIKAYLTLNTIIYSKELERVKTILKKAKQAKVDAVIAWDFAVIQEAKKLKIPIHLSTQASVSNFESANFYKKLGIKRIVLARELSLKQIKEIKNKSKIKIETFIHGSMCVSVSGRCFLSQEIFKKSANRGECLQPCRREYLIKDIDREYQLKIGNQYILSPKDICILPFIEKLILVIDAFKIEGRHRSPEYVKTVTGCYRKAIDFYLENKNKKDFKKQFEKLKKELIKKLKTVYNRDFSQGFYLKSPTADDFTDVYGSRATETKEYLGYVKKFYKKIKVAEVKIQNRGIKINDNLLVIGPTTGVINQKVSSMELNHKKITKAEKGKNIAIKFSAVVRANDKIFLTKPRGEKAKSL